MTDAIVAVRGEATLTVEPELAEFAATVTVRDMDRTAALDRLGDRVDEVRTVLDGFAPAIERHETSRLSTVAETNPASRWTVDVVAYRGSATTTVLITDLDAVGEVMIRLADLDEVTVEGPWWSVRPASPIRRDARRAAIADAIDRARDYAAALGARVIRLVELTDAGLASRSDRAVALSYAASAEGAAGPTLDLDPQRQQVHVSVEARFVISQPTVLGEPVN